MKTFEFGKTIQDRCRIVTLRWHAARVDPSNPSFVDQLSASPGLYAIEGCHDSVPISSVLYIGQTGRQAIRKRAKQSLEARVWWRNTRQGALRLYSDVWDLTLRWAELEKTAIGQVERLLISAHSPPFNSQHARSSVTKAHGDLVIVNTGEKGRLMPTVFGGYFVATRFPWY